MAECPATSRPHGGLGCNLWAHHDEPGSLHWDAEAGTWWQSDAEHVDAVKAAAATAPGDDGALLAESAEALWDCAKAALTVKPTLDIPYQHTPAWTPWTRWVEPPAHQAHDLAMKIRKHLRAGGAR